MSIRCDEKTLLQARNNFKKHILQQAQDYQVLHQLQTSQVADYYNVRETR